jgi:hypothetical protein
MVLQSNGYGVTEERLDLAGEENRYRRATAAGEEAGNDARRCCRRGLKRHLMAAHLTGCMGQPCDRWW